MEPLSERQKKTTMELAAAGAPPPLAVANYGALPPEVLHDVLLRLPADEVCRVRLVCRSWRSLTSGPLFVAAHASRHQHVVVVSHRNHDDDADEVRAVDLHNNVVRRRRARLPADRHVLGRLSAHGGLLCVSHGCGLARVVDMVTGAVVADVDSELERMLHTTETQCFIGHVPSTGEYKVLRILVGCFTKSDTCDVVTLGGGAGGGGGGTLLRWRRAPKPPVNLSIKPPYGFGNMAVVGGLAYFLVLPAPRLGPEDESVADNIAVFDLATEEWRPATLQGPLSSRGRRSTDDDENEAMPILRWEHGQPRPRKRFQLARLGESLVMLFCNVEDCSTELWFLEDMEEDGDDTAARWTRRYTLQRTPFGKDDFFSWSLQYHYPLAILDDGKILVWVNWTGALRIYDPETSVWTDLVTLTKGRVVGMQRGSLLCSNIGVA